MKKVFINIALVLIGFLIYFLQANFFKWFTIAGIKPNLFVIYVLFIGLFGNGCMGMAYGAGWGIILDLIFEERIGINLFGLALIGIIATIFDKNFSKDSRITIMFMVFGSTIIFEVITYFMNYILYAANIEILNFVGILIIEVIYNILITIIIYPLIQKFGYYIENEYKGSRILTKYF
ncbi:MAG: rod shape-determining protein MreD [Clostridia bacterium]|nr:rod shape-determining protein MreD [Clostridia bacterium]